MKTIFILSTLMRNQKIDKNNNRNYKMIVQKQKLTNIIYKKSKEYFKRFKKNICM